MPIWKPERQSRLNWSLASAIDLVEVSMLSLFLFQFLISQLYDVGFDCKFRLL